MSCFDLGIKGLFESTKPQTSTEQPVVKDYTDEVTWLKCMQLRNAEIICDVAGQKIKSIIVHDRAVANAVDTLRQAKRLIGQYGATESLLALFNENNQLSNCIGLTIPEITEANAKVVATACVEGIDATVLEAYQKVKEFFDNICEAAVKFFEKLKNQAVCQKATLETMVKDILGHAGEVDPNIFANGGIYGYSQPAFVQRIAALQFINDNLGNVDCTTDAQRQFAPHLKTLGYKLVEKATEDLDSTGATESPAEIESTPPQEEAKETTLSVAQWTPEAVEGAANVTIQLLGSIDKLAVIPTKLADTRTQVVAAIDSLAQTDEATLATKKQTIECGRAYAAFIGDCITIYGSAVSELVDQIVCMASKIVEALPKNNPAPATQPVPTNTTSTENVQNEDAPQGEGEGQQPAPEGAPKEGEAPAEGQPAEQPQGGEKAKLNNEDAPQGGEQQPAPEGAPQGGGEGEQSPAEGAPQGGEGGGEQPAQPQNKVETPKNVPNAKPVSVPGTNPDGEPHPGDAPHIKPTETPEGEQPGKKAETFLEDIDGTKLW